MRRPEAVASDGRAAVQFSRANIGIPAALLALAAVGWWWSVRMASSMAHDPSDMAGGMGGGMDAMVSSESISLLAFVVAWFAMMTAMMFPAISPVFLPISSILPTIPAVFVTIATLVAPSLCSRWQRADE